jgi:RNA polymerase sigma-70 factor (ECF subfamily)
MAFIVNCGINELLTRAGGGDQLAISELLSRHRDRLKRMVAVRMDPRLSRRVDASDVVQDTFIEAVRKLPEYIQERPIEFYPWLRQLAWNRLVDLYRFHIQGARRAVDREVNVGTGLSDDSVAALARQFATGESSPSGNAVRAELRIHVRMALESLPEKYRDALVMRHLEQLTIKEIAAIVGTPEGTIKARLFRGMRMLHEALADLSSRDAP